MRRIRLARFLMMISRIIPWGFPVRSAVQRHKPIFVFGSGRNGSTLLNRMLNQHPALFCPSEQYFLGPLIIKFYLYRHFINWRDLVKIIVGELNQSSGSHTWETGFNPQMSNLFESENKSLEYLIDSIYRTYGASQKNGFNVWVDTSAPNTQYFREIYRCFPDAYYFFLVRDGRDVVNSYTKGSYNDFGELVNPGVAATHWVDSIKAYHWLTKRTKVHCIKYESMVNDPDSILSETCSHIGLEYLPEMLKFYQEKVPVGFQDEYFKNVKKPVFKTSIGLWEREMESSTLNEVLPILEPYLKQFDYL